MNFIEITDNDCGTIIVNIDEVRSIKAHHYKGKNNRVVITYTLKNDVIEQEIDYEIANR